MDAEAGEARAAPALPGRGPGLRAAPPPQPRPRAPRSPGPHLFRITPGHLLPAPSKLRKICLRLISKPFLYFFFFQRRSNIFQMRQNRDGSEAFSAGACVSAGRGFRLCLGAFLPTALSSLFLPRNFEFCALSGSLGCSLSLTPLSALGIPPSVSPCLSPGLSQTLSPWPFPPSSVPTQSVCLSPSPWPQANFPVLLAGPGLQDH